MKNIKDNLYSDIRFVFSKKGEKFYLVFAGHYWDDILVRTNMNGDILEEIDERYLIDAFMIIFNHYYTEEE